MCQIQMCRIPCVFLCFCDTWIISFDEFSLILFSVFCLSNHHQQHTYIWSLSVVNVWYCVHHISSVNIWKWTLDVFVCGYVSYVYESKSTRRRRHRNPNVAFSLVLWWARRCAPSSLSSLWRNACDALQEHEFLLWAKKYKHYKSSFTFRQFCIFFALFTCGMCDQDSHSR